MGTLARRRLQSKGWFTHRIWDAYHSCSKFMKGGEDIVDDWEEGLDLEKPQYTLESRRLVSK